MVYAMTTRTFVFEDDDPLTRIMQPPSNETPEDKKRRLAEELAAKQRSDAIDEELKRSYVPPSKKQVRVLLLGQSESGKSTTLKQFRLMSNADAFNSERGIWRLVVYLNLVRSIRNILDALTCDLELESLSESRPSLDSVDYHEMHKPSARSMSDSSTLSASISSNSTTSTSLYPEDNNSEEESQQTPTRSVLAPPLSPSQQRPPTATSLLAFIQEMRLRLVPLIDVEESILKRMSVLFDSSSPDEGTAASSSPSTHLRNHFQQNGFGLTTPSAPGSATRRERLQHDFFVRPGSGWKKAMTGLNESGGNTKSKSRTSGENANGGGTAAAAPTGGNKKGGKQYCRVRNGAIDPDDREDPGHIICACKDDMTRLWLDEGVREKVRSSRLKLEESGGFFLDDVERIASREYVPSDEDILRARIRTVGITEHDFNFKGYWDTVSDWRVYDVGGAKSQRAAWAPYFDNVNAIIFLCPISAFDQSLSEDRNVNRLMDSFHLWSDLCRNPVLKDVPLVLFLNKCDILKKKIEAGIKLNEFIISYKDRPNDYDSAVKYFQRSFDAVRRRYSPKSRPAYIHLTSVIDTVATLKIIVVVGESILRLNLQEMALI